MNNTKTTREAVGIFNDNEKLQEAINELCTAHFERYDISVLGNEAAIKEKFKQYRNPHELVDNPQTPRSINIAPEEMGVAQGAVIGGGILVGVVAALTAAGGVALPSTIPATVIGITAGSVIGSALAKLVGDTYLESLQKQIDKGGLIIWVRTTDENREKVACGILKNHGAEDVHIHEIQLESA